MIGIQNTPLNNLNKIKTTILTILITLNCSSANGSNHNNYQLFEIENTIVTCSLDIKDNIANLSVKSRIAVDINKPKNYSYIVNFNPNFIDGKKVYSSTLIDYEIVRVTKDGKRAFFRETNRKGEKFIEIFSKDVNSNLVKEIEQGKHIYEVWYKARNIVVPGIEVQSFDYQISNNTPIKNIDLTFFLGPSLVLTNTKINPFDDSLVVRGDNSYVRVYNFNEKTLKSTKLTINFKESKEHEEKVLNNITSKPIYKHQTTNTLVLFFDRNFQRIEFILALISAIASICVLIWYLRLLSK